MKINTKTLIFIIFGIAFGITLLFLIINVYNDPQIEQRDRLRSRDGISMGHNHNMQINEMAFYIINTHSTDSIILRYNATLMNPEDAGKIGIFFPYNMDLISDKSDWEEMSFDTGTAFLKKYSCTSNEYCKNNYFEEYEFQLIPETSKFDSKNGYKHGIKIKVDHVIPNDVDEFFREFNMAENNPLIMTYDAAVKRQITIIVLEDADNIHPIPIPDPDIFHNRGLDYSNTQLDWHILKESQSYFVDYELPDERKQFDNAQTNISLIGIVMGIIVGLFGIALAIESTKKKQTIRDVKY